MQDKIFPQGLPKSPIETLSQCGKPILLYGMGDGAEKVAALLREKGIPLSGVFATESTRSERRFLGFPVFGVEELSHRYPNGAVALVAFGCDAADMRMYLGRLRRQKIEAMLPHLPLFGGSFFDGAYYEAHRDDFGRLYDALADDGSRTLLRALLTYMLSWRPEDLLSAPTNRFPVETVLGSLRPKKMVDGGAYRGDTALRFSSFFPSLETVLAFEPDSRNFEKLASLKLPHGTLVAMPYGLWSHTDALSFDASHNRGAHFTPGHGSVPVCALDGVPESEDAGFVKLDVEGCEKEVLSGASHLLNRRRAAWHVSVYHKTDDLFTLPLFFTERGYNVYLYREPVCPAWDVQLVAIPK